jgi:hypothetical protein
LENVMAQTQANDGRVTAVHGAVLDVVFEGTTLPPIDAALIIMPNTDTPIPYRLRPRRRPAGDCQDVVFYR